MKWMLIRRDSVSINILLPRRIIGNCKVLNCPYMIILLNKGANKCWQYVIISRTISVVIDSGRNNVLVVLIGMIISYTNGLLIHGSNFNNLKYLVYIICTTNTIVQSYKYNCCFSPLFSLFYLKYIVIIKTNEIKYKPTYNKKEKSNASNNWARFQCDESFCKDTTGS